MTSHLVINLREHRELPEGAIYVGRAVPRRGLLASPYANPFPIRFVDHPSVERAHVLERYRRWLLERPELLERIRRELPGKTLACWCAPLACHADILVRVALGGAP